MDPRYVLRKGTPGIREMNGCLCLTTRLSYIRLHFFFKTNTTNNETIATQWSKHAHSCATGWDDGILLEIISHRRTTQSIRRGILCVHGHLCFIEINKSSSSHEYIWIYERISRVHRSKYMQDENDTRDGIIEMVVAAAAAAETYSNFDAVGLFTDRRNFIDMAASGRDAFGICLIVIHSLWSRS